MSGPERHWNRAQFYRIRGAATSVLNVEQLQQGDCEVAKKLFSAIEQACDGLLMGDELLVTIEAILDAEIKR